MVYDASTAEEFNAKHPIGTPVEYWALRRQGAGEEGYTRSLAWTVGDGPGRVATPVVAVRKKGGRAVPGGIALTHIRVRTDD